MRALLFASTAALALAACGDAAEDSAAAPEAAENEEVQLAQAGTADTAAAADAEPAGRAPEETRPPNAAGQEPAFENQTRAPVPAETESWTTEEVASGLQNIWAFEFLPDGDMLVTERPGTMRVVAADGTLGEPLANVPEVVQGGQAGLLDVALAPDFETSRRIFFSFSEPREGGQNGTSVASATLSADETALEDVEVIFRQTPGSAPPLHYGSRLAFAPDGTLFVTLGERFLPPARENSFTPDTYLGKVVRINADGSIPDDNPFAGADEGEPGVWSYGHRNVQGATIHPETGELWTMEHGPQGGDELNNPQAGNNHGWPFVTYGQDYSGEPMYEGITQQDGVTQPVYYWDPVIAPSGMEFYTGDLFPQWQGDLFIAGMASTKVVRLTMEDGRVTGEEWLPMEYRIRDLQQGPDGALYVGTDEADAKILRIAPD